MATTQVKTVKKTALAARSDPAQKTAGKPKAAPAVRKLAATKAANKERTATSAPKPASMTGPLPPIVTLKHLAEWAGYVWRCLTRSAIALFLHPAHRTGHADFLHRILGEDVKPSPTARCTPRRFVTSMICSGCFRRERDHRVGLSPTAKVPPFSRRTPKTLIAIV
jgi:hypothetical protein